CPAWWQRTTPPRRLTAPPRCRAPPSPSTPAPRSTTARLASLNERSRRPGFGRRAAADPRRRTTGLCRCAVLGGGCVFRVPDRHRRVQPALEQRGARRARRLPAARHLRALPAGAPALAGLGHWRG